jgi:SAM-dependent methyltransferase
MPAATQTIAPPADYISTAPTPDYKSLKSRQQIAWSSGDYAVVGTTLQIVGETLCEALDLRAGQKVLDVAAGNGNVTLAAARRWCDVVSTDYVPALLECGRERATAERLAIEFREADAEALPFPDVSFDVVGRLHDRHIGRLSALEDAADIDGSLTEGLQAVVCVGHQTTGLRSSASKASASWRSRVSNPSVKTT